MPNRRALTSQARTFELCLPQPIALRRFPQMGLCFPYWSGPGCSSLFLLSSLLLKLHAACALDCLYGRFWILRMQLMGGGGHKGV